jgi:hypothetical protein
MGWTEQSTTAGREWCRDDGAATLRLRVRPDGRWVVRLDRLHQAPAGSRYRQVVVEDGAEALAQVEAWKRAYDDEAGTGGRDGR